MIPLRDTLRARSFPLVNWILIAVNAGVFLFQLSLTPSALARLVGQFGLVAARFPFDQPIELLTAPYPMVTLLTSIFMHGGWFHFLSNIWVLHIFGDNIEDRMGPGKYLVFYLSSGVIANLMQSLILPTSRIPAIGASGAIAGVMGAYFLLHPRARVLTLTPIFLFPWFWEAPAVIYLGFWFFSQLYSGFFSLNLPAGASMGGVAWWAHVGGFLFGIAAASIFANPPDNDGTVIVDHLPPDL